MSSSGKLKTGIPSVKKSSVVIIRTEWNAAIVDALAAGCRQLLLDHKIHLLHDLVVPGAFEIPFTIHQYWNTKKTGKRPDAFIALGCVIRGDTPHFDYVCKGITEGIIQLNLKLPVPVIFGVLTVNTEEQALERIGGKHGHKGKEAAEAAIKMIALNQSFKKNNSRH